MSNYNTLKTTINANIKQNGNQEITGQILNSVLNQMVTTLGAEYQFAGVATTATNPGTPDAKVFYIAKGKGTYTNFGGLEVTEDDVVVLYWDTAWHKVSTGIASQAKLSELAGYVDSKVDAIAATKQDVLTAGKGIVIDDNNTISINFDPDIFKVVSVLPDVPAAGDEKKVHLVPSDSGESGNAYDEYIYVDGSWEKIGSFRPSIDLSEYAKTADIPVKKGTGDDSIVQKGGNNASGTYSSAFGFSTVSNGNASHTEGISTIALNAYEHAEGRGNVSIKDKTVHTVGIGSLDGRVRKNAEEIHRSGDKYVIGIGGYDGTNSQTEGVKTVQEVVEETNTKIDAKADKSYVDDKYTALDSRTPVDSGISFVNPWELFKEYSTNTTDVQGYIEVGFLEINGQMTDAVGLFNYIRDNNLANKSVYFTISSNRNSYTKVIGSIVTGAVGYQLCFSTVSGYNDGSTSQNHHLLVFEVYIGDVIGTGTPTIINSMMININLHSTITQINTNKSKITTLETKNTELTNTVTSLETRIAELENIISQITIKEE